MNLPTERAERVMLNQGPHILEAICTPDDLKRRMKDHEPKYRPLHRAPKSWNRVRG